MKKNSETRTEISGTKRIVAAAILATYIITSSPAMLFAQEIKKEKDVFAQSSLVIEEKEEVLIPAKDGGRVVLGEASIEIPKGALKKDTAISITRLSKVSDTGESLYNATAKSGGYRFLPEGTKFLKDVTITLPYSKELNTKEQALNELYTYFYDTAKKQWIKLERLEVDRENCVVRSLSTHFTDMINATLTLPESASPVDVNLNSIKNLEAAKPGSHLIKFNQPKMSNMGDASFSLELGVPSGRRGIEPSVCVNYSSGSGNGIMGKGFDVTYESSITTDTRFGLPNYDTRDTYMLDGIELKETSRRGATITYSAQKESSFSRIVRYNAGTSLDCWEVTDKSGTKRIYEQNNSSCTGRGTRTFTWNVTKIEDVHANNVIYEYEKSDGYVYPAAIYYTGFDGQKGNYSVRFHYDENGTKRQDIRIDARSKEIISCKKLLTSITTHYKNQEAIRTYSFSYTEGLAKEKMLTSLAVQNNADESYEYTFDYVKPEKDGNGNDIYFAEAKEWENGKAISESGGKSSGTNVHTSAGAGFGFSAIDARGTGGITGSSSSSSGYAKELLTDIDGDGKCESIVQTGSVLNIYRQNGTGTGFSQKAQRIDLSKIKENSATFLMNEESSSTSSFGWNVYGGAGTTHGAASIGYVHSDVNQEGTSKLHTGFYDMDGDGLVDIVTGTNEYLHNDTREGGAVSFSSRKIINYPETVVKKLDSEALKNYRKSYCLQRPFMAWKSLYDGTVNIRTTRAGSGAVKILAVYGDEKISREDGLAVGQGKSLYFVPDVGNSPNLSDLEKEISWTNTIEYSKAKIFGRKFEMPVFFPDEIMPNCPSALEGLYEEIRGSAETGEKFSYYKLKGNFKALLTKESRAYLLTEGRFVPGVLNEALFEKLKARIKAKGSRLADSNSKDEANLFYEKFASSYSYSVSDRMFHLAGDIDRDFYSTYIKDFVANETLSELISGYSLNGVAADLSESTVSYKVHSSEILSGSRRYENGTFSAGSSYVEDGKELFCIGKISGSGIAIDTKNKTAVTPAEFEKTISVTDFSEDKCVLSVDDGKYDITYSFEEKIPYADSISQEEFLLIASDFEGNYPDNSLDSDVWKTPEPVDKSTLKARLQNAYVSDGQEQENFIALAYDETVKTDEVTQEEKILFEKKTDDGSEEYKENRNAANEILKNAMYRKIRAKDFPFYDDSNRLKNEYAGLDYEDETISALVGECSKHNLYRYKKSGVEIKYCADAYYDIDKGKTTFLIPKSSVSSEITGRTQTLEFPDGTAVFNSGKDFSSDSIAESKHALLLLDGTEENGICFPVEEPLYGGRNGWFYGIWTGSEDENSFSETKLHGILKPKDGMEGHPEYDTSDISSEDDVRNLGESKSAAVESNPVQSQYAFGCTLPQKNGAQLEGVASHYIKESVYDENGVLKVNSVTFESKPRMSAGKVVCNRLGGNAYYSIEGVPENTASIAGVLQKTETSGKDITSGPQVSVLSLQNMTSTTNSGSSKMIQSLQDVNADRIPDVLKIEGNVCKIYFGAKDSSGNIEYPSSPSLVSGIVTALSKNENESSSNGFSFSPSGAIQTLYSPSGKEKSISLTNGFGHSSFSGTNSTHASVLDMNADGIADYVTSGAAYLGKGDGYELAFGYAYSAISRGSVSGTSENLSVGGGIPFDKSSASQDLSTSASAGIGGCASISTSVQDQMLLDMNGDGLLDVVCKSEWQGDAENCIYTVYYNTGSKIDSSSPAVLRIPKWKTVSLGHFTVNNGAINSNKISYGGSSANLAETAEIDLSGVSGKIENLDCSVTVSANITGNLAINVNIPIPVPFTVFKINATVDGGGGITSGTTSTSATVKMLDMDGDGLCDHVLRIPGFATYWKRNLSGKFGLLNRINLPQGGSVSLEYAEKYGTVDNPVFKYVLSEVTVDDGCDETLPAINHGEHSVTTKYEYSDAYYDRQKKDFYGFEKVVSTFADGTYSINEYYNREYYSKGVLKESRSYSADDVLLARSKTELCPSPYALPEKEESWTYEKASGTANVIHTSTIYEYDDFGNCTKVTQDFGDGEKLVGKVEYDNSNVADYIIGLPVDIQVYNASASLLRHRAGKYNGFGELVELYQYFDSYSHSTNILSYDEYGNIKRVSDSRGATLSYTYDNQENMFVTEIAQSSKDTDTYTSRINYDIATQTKTSETDCNKNSMRYEYDAWQRVTKIFTSYDGATPAVSYEYFTPQKDMDSFHNLWYTMTSNKVTFDSGDDSVIKTVLQVDGLGRAVRTAKTGFVNGRNGWNASGAIEYDSKGRTVKEGMTEFIEGSLESLLNSKPKMTDLFTSYEYDEKDRQVKTILPDGSVQSAAFELENGKSITRSTDPLGNVSLQETDSRGNIVRVAKFDESGKQLTQVTYKYNAIGEMLKAFDAKGNPIKAEYDLLGRRTALESLDSGRQEFFYDECSNLVRENNSVLRENNKQIIYEYDGLNRLVKIDYPDTQDTVYAYGGANASNGAAGKILSVTDASGTLSYEYGKLGEVTKETRTLNTHLNGINDNETAVMEYRSDYLGRMQHIVYPDGEKITYGYDAGGQVVSVTGSHFGYDFDYVTNILYDEYGQRTRIDYGNGTFTECDYDPARRWLDSIKTENKWGQSYQNITYSFDAVGNVLGYENDCLDSVTGNYKTKQTYSYDNLYQLIKVDGTTTYNPHKSSVPEFISDYSQVFEFDKDGLGNMTSKVSTESVSPQKSIGDNLNYSFDYVYDENFAHRLVRVGERYYKYDANGNIVCEQDGDFENGNGGDDVYYKITQEADNVYSTDYGWGLFNEKDSGGGSVATKYRRTYTWDEKNRLISSVDANYSTAYVYGQDGQRSNKYTQNSETLYFNKMWTLHTDSGNNIYGGQSAKNIYLGETRIVTKLNSGNAPTYQEEYYKQYYYHSDHLGSASLISDYKGDEYQRIEYTPYGETWVEKTSNTGLEFLPYKFTAKELDKETGLYYYGARYLDAKYSRWLSADPALGDYVSKTSKGEGGIYNSINLNLYHYTNNNPVKYTDPDGKFAVVPMLIGGAISVAVDYGFQVAGNYMQGKRGSDAWTDVNVGEIAGAFVSGALTTVGIGAVTKVAGTATSAAVRKGIQVAGNAAVSAATSVPGTITENAVNNLVNPDNKVALTENVKDNAIKSGISGGVVSALAKTPAMSVKTPKGYKPNNIPYKQVGPNKYVRKGPMPGSIQAGAVQLTKDVGGEIFGQGVSKEVSNIYDNIKNHKQPQNVENE